jgi:hypothetical protein
MDGVTFLRQSFYHSDPGEILCVSREVLKMKKMPEVGVMANGVEVTVDEVRMMTDQVRRTLPENVDGWSGLSDVVRRIKETRTIWVPSCLSASG